MPADYLPVLDTIKAGEWDAVHRLIQAHSDPLACRIHAYLHRQQGDLENADYWYARARMSAPGNSMADELDCLYQMAQTNRLD